MSNKILVVEDSSVIQSLTKRILTIRKYEVTLVKNGVEALRELEKNRYDLLLLDIYMPEMDGITCAGEIRKNNPGGNQHIPIIAITGNIRNYSKEDFRQAGINDFLPKPLNYDTMVEMVKSYLKG